MSDITVAKDTQQQDWKIGFYKVKAATKLVAGAAVMTDASGWLVNAADTASCLFQGILDKTVDNTVGAAANGSKVGRVITVGAHDFVFSGTATQATVGLKVYAVDNQTVAVVATTTNDVLVGVVTEFISATKVRVRLLPGLAS
jgi:hypothetical protein